jgi:cell wall-associated NlpC family hydrolase
VNRRTFLAAAAVALAAGAAKQAPAVATGSHTAPDRAARVAIAYARAQLGKPYVWGGTGPDGFDCSGLTYMAYRSAGIHIARTSQDQWATLPHITGSQLRPGDLIFYKGSDGTITSPGHVVLYIGGGRVIQAYAAGTPIEITLLADMQAGDLTGYARP